MEFTKDWFAHSEIKEKVTQYVDGNKRLKLLEIGSYEGLSTVYFIANLLHHEESSIVCIDPFDITDKTTPVSEQTMTLFKNNVSKSKYPDKVTFYHGYSKDFFKENREVFDFIYIDGSHDPSDIIVDMNETWKIVRPGGIVWLDDYLGGVAGEIKGTMNSFIKEHAKELEIIHSGYQLAYRKL